MNYITRENRNFNLCNRIIPTITNEGSYKLVTYTDKDTFLFDLPNMRGRVNKGICGVGGTYRVINSGKDVVLILPTIKVLEEKLEQYPDTLGVYGDVDVEDIYNYIHNMRNKNLPLKIFVIASDSIRKLNRVFENLKLFNSTLCVLDELQLITESGSYRSSVEIGIQFLVKFKNFITLTATPVLNEHPLIKNTNMYEFIDNNGKEDNNFISINLSKYKDKVVGYCNNSDKPTFLFYDNVSAVKSILDAIDDTKVKRILCSSNSKIKADKYYINSLPSKYEKNGIYALTSSYFTAVDINEKNANIIILVNTHTSTVTPQSIKQIQGRFRNGYSTCNLFITGLTEYVNYETYITDQYNLVMGNIVFFENFSKYEKIDKSTLENMNIISDLDNKLIPNFSTIQGKYINNITDNIYSSESNILNTFKDFTHIDTIQGLNNEGVDLVNLFHNSFVVGQFYQSKEVKIWWSEIRDKHMLTDMTKSALILGEFFNVEEKIKFINKKTVYGYQINSIK